MTLALIKTHFEIQYMTISHVFFLIIVANFQLYMHISGRTFFDVALTRDRSLHHWVWVLGEEEVAQQYLYEITAFKGNVK